MGLLSRLKSKLGRKSKGANPAPLDAERFVYVKIPESIGPVDRGSKYEAELDRLLASASVGSVSGGGSSLGATQPDGTRPIEFCGIDIDVSDLEKARELLRRALPTLGAPIGTEIQFTIGRAKLQDTFASDGWRLAEPRTFLHPGFNV